MEEEEPSDLTWWTEEEKERLAKELHYLKFNQYDQETGEYRDIRWMYFRREVLEKYRNNEMCEIGNEHISLLQNDKNKTASDTE